jgi:hypothetical protein
MLDQLSSLYQLPFFVFPNPSSGIVTIDMGEDDQTPVEIQVFTLPGQLVFQRNFNNSAQLKNIPLNLSHVPSGLYVLKMKYGSLIFNRN